MTRAEAVRRAQSALGHSLAYGNGQGGMHPEDSLPTRTGHCDCSGFVMWALGRCRFDGTLWWDTSRIVDDAIGDHLNFARMAWSESRVGDILVYGDRMLLGKVRQGHIGLVTAAGPDGATRVIHCSKGAWSIYMDAIHEDGPEKWAPRGVAARCLWLEHPKMGEVA